MIPKRVLLGKPGLDGHDRGVMIIARALRDAGHEVIYTGIHVTPEELASMAVQEDVDVVGLSILAGGHVGLTAEVVEALRARGADDIPVLLGGTIPDRDVEDLKKLGVSAVFPVTSQISDIVAYVNALPSDRGLGL